MLSNELGDIIDKKEAVIKQLTNNEELSKDDDELENFGDLTGICISIYTLQRTWPELSD